ncbi:MAG TPA: DUF4386 domain-containing protein [Longimicrobiaceae bacterium]|nr:DUF4386 domain-containing protein [Longimicrobiaceae bacterium]
MDLTERPRLVARAAGVFYLVIIATAVFAYMVVRGQVIIPGDMPRTAANLVAHERLYRLGFSSAVVTVVCNPPMGLALYELLKVVNPRVALLALVSITVSTTIEAVNLFNYISPLFTVTLPEYRAAFEPSQLQALARGSIRLFGYGFSVSLSFFGIFCALIGFLIVRSTFLPRSIGFLMIAAGVCYWIDNLVLFLALPRIPNIVLVSFVAEASLALWLLIAGVNEVKWRARVPSHE